MSGRSRGLPLGLEKTAVTPSAAMIISARSAESNATRKVMPHTPVISAIWMSGRSDSVVIERLPHGYATKPLPLNHSQSVHNAANAKGRT